MKTLNSNTIINVIVISVCIIFTALIFMLDEQKILMGVLFRLTFSLLIIYNAIYLIFSSKVSLMVKRGEEKYRRFAGILLLIVGLFGFVTALMGYGINGYPLLDWKTILK